MLSPVVMNRRGVQEMVKKGPENEREQKDKVRFRKNEQTNKI